MQRTMQSLQSDLEKIGDENSALEQDFENEINKKNENAKELGQIIKAINNIYNQAVQQQKSRGKIKKLEVKDISEEYDGLFGELIARLEMVGETVEDLVDVANQLGTQFDRNKAYGGELADQMDDKNKQKMNVRLV